MIALPQIYLFYNTIFLLDFVYMFVFILLDSYTNIDKEFIKTGEEPYILTFEVKELPKFSGFDLYIQMAIINS